MDFLKTEFKRFFSVTKWVLSLYFKTFPVYTTIYVVCRILVSFSNLFNAYVIALVTDEAIKLIGTGQISSSIYKILALFLGTAFFFTLVDIVNSYVWRMITYQEWWKFRKILSERLLKLGINQLENPELTNKIQRFNESSSLLSEQLQITVNTIAVFITFVGSGFVIFSSIPLVAVIYLGVVIIESFSNQKFIRLLWLLNRNSTEERRKAATMSNILIEPAPLKELVLSGGTIYLQNKIDVFIDAVTDKFKKIRTDWNKAKIINKLLDSTIFGYGIYQILLRVINKVISVGQFTFEVRSLRIFADNLSQVASNIVDLRESAVKISDIYDIFSTYGQDIDGKIKIKTSDNDILFENVDFKYENSTRKVFNNLNLKIKAGEKIAIVGENGAGKTTLIKLLCRLYRPINGKILIGTLDINDIEISSWYKNMGILFQDYNAYTSLTVKENVEIDTEINKVTDESITNALKKANALDFVLEYKNGVDQILSERYKGGIRPSTGQWQKIAIARVFHRNAPVLILDEPTASIDAVAEAQIFDNIYKFSKDKTVIIISHRFSTVRNADRIIVLDKGKIIEEGSHEELLKINGKYAKAFKLQAKGYQ
jgi:ATP-binding cassette subfamily B protein